jgi:hypothetical protein
VKAAKINMVAHNNINGKDDVMNGSSASYDCHGTLFIHSLILAMHYTNDLLVQRRRRKFPYWIFIPNIPVIKVNGIIIVAVDVNCLVESPNF